MDMEGSDPDDWIDAVNRGYLHKANDLLFDWTKKCDQGTYINLSV